MQFSSWIRKIVPKNCLQVPRIISEIVPSCAGWSVNGHLQNGRRVPNVQFRSRIVGCQQVKCIPDSNACQVIGWRRRKNRVANVNFTILYLPKLRSMIFLHPDPMKYEFIPMNYTEIKMQTEIFGCRSSCLCSILLCLKTDCSLNICWTVQTFLRN